MEDVVYREMRTEDVPSALELRNEVFRDASVTAQDWEIDNMTASIAVLGGRVVGAIPFVVRDLVVTPGVVVRAPFENAVGTREDLRSRGIGSGMIAAAREFVRDRADGLFVYRGAERSAGYRFYVKSGHHDLGYARSYRLNEPTDEPRTTEATVLGVEAIRETADVLLPLFRSTYGQFGGYPRRDLGYWGRSLSSSIFAAIPTELLLVLVSQGETAGGYAIVGIRTGRKADGLVHIMEMATRSADLSIARRVLSVVQQMAKAREMAVVMRLTDDDPFVPALRLAGFEPSPRAQMTMILGQIIDIPAFFDRYWRQRVQMNGAGLRVWTPQQDHILAEPEHGYPTLTLEMKEETLHRWLLGRIDLAARLREGTVTAHQGSAAQLQAISIAIPWTPWAYHHLDWI